MGTMYEDEFSKMTARSLSGERAAYWCLNHRHARNMFREYVHWLTETGAIGWSAMRVTLRICFDGGGEIRFVSYEADVEGVKAFYIEPSVLDY